jgi:prevent-host-death family protein
MIRTDGAYSDGSLQLQNFRNFRIFVKRSFDMTSTVTAAAISKNFGAYQDAAVRDPVIITKNGRPRTVLIAYEDYLRLTKRDRRVELTSALGDDDLAAIEASETDGPLDHLNTELLTGKNAAD